MSALDIAMSAPTLPSASTPKRKRSQLEESDAQVSLPTAASPSPEDVSLPPSSPADDPSISPRSKVVHRFRSLAIGRPRSFAELATNTKFSPATRDFTSTVPETPQQPERKRDDAVEEYTDGLDCSARKRLKGPRDDTLRPTTEAGSGLPPQPQRKPRSKPDRPAVAFAVERPATPPLRNTASAAADPTESTPPAAQPPGPTFQWPPSPPDTAVSPQSDPISVAFRASMTWQENEITIYDPDDSDDDGTGINGIGFKPTAAVAYARDVRRKQQLAEYRKREEREARARRSQRRRASPRPPAGDEKREGKKAPKGERENERQRRKVRFLEASAVTTAAVATES